MNKQIEEILVVTNYDSWDSLPPADVFIELGIQWKAIDIREDRR